MTDDKLENLRAKIDELDLQILDLLNRRMTLSLAIGRLKAAENQNAMDSVREQEILRRLKAHSAGPILARDSRSCLSGNLFRITSPAITIDNRLSWSARNAHA